MADKASFSAFFLVWAERRGWSVPAVHWRAVDWLARRGDFAVLRCFRGFGKSTLLAVYNAWRYYCDPEYRILHQSEADGTAYKTSRDTQAVLRAHPWTQGMFKEGGVEQWWVDGSTDPRNASMYARGILSNVTSARADECQNDDVEVPRNIRTPEAREQLEYRLGEQTFILVPGGRQLFIGTPHTHDSLYDKMEALGADCLTIPLFEREYRINQASGKSYSIPFAPEYVFSGIGKGSRLLAPDVDYRVNGRRLEFASPPGTLIDCYSGCAWPERFTREDLQKRRRKTKTVNYWDSQYQLHSRPVHEMRLNPERIPLYDVEPRFEMANKVPQCWLGKARIVGASLHWDPASNKLRSDTSALALVLQDENGRWYWHRCQAVEGGVVEFAPDNKTIVGGQVSQICDVIEKFRIRRVTVETNGPGEFAPKVLLAAIKQRGLVCGVKGDHESRNKNQKILDAFENIMLSGMLWAHVSVADGPAFPQMKEWNPAVHNQPDDYLDATAVALGNEPQRMADSFRNRNPLSDDHAADWRPGAGVFEAELEI